MMEYKVVIRPDLDQMVRLVNVMIEEGWVPCGGASVRQGKSYDTYIQAMTCEPWNKGSK